MSRKVEIPDEIQHYTFEEFQSQLGWLREIASDLAQVNLGITKEENYKSCVQNLKKRMDLLDMFAAKLKEEKNGLEADFTKFSKDPEKRVELMEARSKLKTVSLFQEVVEHEKKREDFYRKKAVEKYMENYLEIKEVLHSNG
ncbi:hypothetical protein EGW08_000424 [Elysia chlorotica]|uniref:Uncharacterized protein n=1 Tax=Elysia chlorotica TaxID=188477 RepID=A0A3S1BMS2_ELYCH|nr:hypothetical protein EGW08_000424 [Elysia chlorotica]